MTLTLCVLCGQIRRLVSERTEKERQLSTREEELRRLEGRLHNATTEKNSLQARLAGVEKELKETHKANDLLKNKVGLLHMMLGMMFHYSHA